MVITLSKKQNTHFWELYIILDVVSPFVTIINRLLQLNFE